MANDAISHVPLLGKGHISTMMDGMPSADAHGWLHQLQKHKLMQHMGRVVCPEGLNGELEALQFHLPRAAPLGHSHSQGTLLRTANPRS